MSQTKVDADSWILLYFAMVWLTGAGILYSNNGYHTGFLTLNQLGHVVPSQIWQVVTFLGDENLLLSLALLTFRRHPAYAKALFWAVLCGFLLTRSMKEGFNTMRPPLVLAADSFHLVGSIHKHHSFPSGHTQLIFTVMGSLYLYTNWRLIKFLALILAVLVGFSRIAVGVHWPIDVCVGASVGLVAAWSGFWLAKHYPLQPIPGYYLLIGLLLMNFPIQLVIGYDSGLEIPNLIGPAIGWLVLAKLFWDFCATTEVV